MTIWQACALSLTALIGGALNSVAGGDGGVTIAQRLDPRLIHRVVILIGFALSAYFFFRTYA